MHDAFGDRMKRYEAVSDTKLINLSPVIVRLDGRAFHTLTKKLDKPYDVKFSQAMTSTMWHMVRTVQNCVFGFTQSDEISLLVIEPTYISDSWFDNRVQKIVSIAAAEASCFFRDYINRTLRAFGADPKYLPFSEKAVFDCRVFNIPVHEVSNYFIWRQQDCLRNAILGVGQTLFSQKRISGLNCVQVVEKIKAEKDIDFYEYYPQEYIWGKIGYKCNTEKGVEIYTDAMIPAPDFKEDRFTIEQHLPDYLFIEE